MNAPVRTLTLYQLADDYLTAFDAFTAEEDGFVALRGLKSFYKLATPIVQAA